MKRLLCLLFTSITLSAFAQQMGSIKSYTTEGGIVTIKSTNGMLVIQRYADYGWKVTTLPEGKTMADERPSVTLIGTAMDGVTVTDNATELVIAAGNVSVIANKQTSLLSFMDNGVVRLSEKTCLDNASDSVTFVTFVFLL